MLKKLFLALAIIIFSFACQTKENSETITVSGNIQNIKVGEKIRIMYDGGASTAVAVSLGANVIFNVNGTIPKGKSKYIAIYPSTLNATFSNGKLEIVYPDELSLGTNSRVRAQIAAVNSINNTLNFLPACSFVKFSVNTNSVYECRLYADDAICGTCSYTFDNNLNFTTTIIKEGSNEKRILLAPEASDSKPYVTTGCSAGEIFIPVIPGSGAKNFTLRMKDIKGWSFPSLSFTATESFSAETVIDLGDSEQKMKKSSGCGSTSFRAMTFNILRGDTEAEHLWPSRKKACLEMFETDKPDIIGLQECNSEQRYDILANLPQYAAIGVSWMGDKTGAYKSTSSNTIIYLSEKFELLKWGTYWNSPDPDRWPSSDNDNPTWYYSKSINTNWAVFSIKNTDKKIVFICSHMVANSSGILPEYKSNASTYAGKNKEEVLKLLSSKISTEINPEGYPMIYVADFNCSGEESYCKPLNDIMQKTKLIATITDTGRTVNSFGEKSTLHYDHIFCKGFNVPLFGVDRNAYSGVQYISDHYPVYADLVIK